MKYLQSRKRDMYEPVLEEYVAPKLLYIDFETYSRINLSDFGAWAYAEDLSTEVLFMSYAFDDEETRVWDNTIEKHKTFPIDVLAAISNGTVVVAHNAGFEDAIWQKTLDLPPIPSDQMIDTMTLALSLAYPASLDKLGAFLGLPLQMIPLPTPLGLPRDVARIRPGSDRGFFLLVGGPLVPRHLSPSTLHLAVGGVALIWHYLQNKMRVWWGSFPQRGNRIGPGFLAPKKVGGFFGGGQVGSTLRSAPSGGRTLAALGPDLNLKSTVPPVPEGHPVLLLDTAWPFGPCGL